MKREIDYFAVRKLEDKHKGLVVEREGILWGDMPSDRLPKLMSRIATTRTDIYRELGIDYDHEKKRLAFKLPGGQKASATLNTSSMALQDIIEAIEVDDGKKRTAAKRRDWKRVVALLRRPLGSAPAEEQTYEHETGALMLPTPKNGVRYRVTFKKDVHTTPKTEIKISTGGIFPKWRGPTDEEERAAVETMKQMAANIKIPYGGPIESLVYWAEGHDGKEAEYPDTSNFRGGVFVKIDGESETGYMYLKNGAVDVKPGFYVKSKGVCNPADLGEMEHTRWRMAEAQKTGGGAAVSDLAALIRSADEAILVEREKPMVFDVYKGLFRIFHEGQVLGFYMSDEWPRFFKHPLHREWTDTTKTEKQAVIDGMLKQQRAYPSGRIEYLILQKMLRDAYDIKRQQHNR
ncbi:MAG: hypothetical protein V1875_01010 [Candidatus Altiarchaeota archaeon]